MLKKIRIAFLAALLAVLCPLSVFADTKPQVSAKSAVVIGADSRKVLYAKNSRERLPIASTTKIMTALITLEAAAKNDKTITVTNEMVRVEGSSMGLRAGNRLTLKALAEGMLAVSGNDAANSAAIAVGGSLDGFAQLMNRKAKSLGMNDTHFVTPSGLDDENHYSSAYDLAILTAAAMENNDFSEIVCQRKIKVSFSSPIETRYYLNHNKLLDMYDGCIGVKTGFTKKSGRCLVSSAEKDGVRLVAVTLNDPCDWEDHKRLLDYGFTQLVCDKIDDSGFCVSLPVVGGTVQTVPVAGTAGENITVTPDEAQKLKRHVELPRFVYAPVAQGQVLGCVRYTVDGKTVAQTDLTANGNVSTPVTKKSFIQNIFDKIKLLFSI